LFGLLGLPLTLLAAPVAADTGFGDVVTAPFDQYPAARAKTEDAELLAPDGAGPGGVPAHALQHAGSAVGTATRAVEAAPKGCLPYSVRTDAWISDEDGFQVFHEVVRFRMQWCADGAHDIAPGEGTCETRAKPPYLLGVGRCWWSKGRWGGNGFSFQTGGVYHVQLAPAGVVLPAAYATIDLSYGGVWWGPPDGPDRTGNCTDPPGLPLGWNADCTVYASSDWAGVTAGGQER
jgi:hypothetical protein